jgi:energy-coupling factor transport system ATP-binding protein
MKVKIFKERAMEPIIRLQDVQFEYLSFEGEEIAALNGVTLDIQKGEFVAIIGHNGSGKSTLAKHLNALLRPSGGVVWIKGMDTRDEDKLWEIRQTAGMVFQNPDNQLVATVVEEDVAFGPENLGLTPEEIQRRVAEALKVVGMQEYAQAAPHCLSGGQKQRVAIAGILAMKPEIIVLDEPTAMLDPVGRREVMETVKYLNKHEGITVVHITHYMEEAVDADRVIVMEQGKIVLQGTPRQVFSQVEVLKEIGLDVPQVTELAYRLRAEGLDVPLNVLKVEEMVDAICRL